MKIKNAVLIVLCAATLSSSLDAGPGDLWRSFRNYIQSFNRPRLPQWLKRPQLTRRNIVIGSVGALAIGSFLWYTQSGDAKEPTKPSNVQDANKQKVPLKPIIRHRIAPSLNQNDPKKESDFKATDVVKLIKVDASDSRQEYLNQTGMVISIDVDEKNLVVYFRDFNGETQIFPKDDFEKISSITDYLSGPFSVGSEKIQQENLDKEPEFEVGDPVKLISTDSFLYTAYVNHLGVVREILTESDQLIAELVQPEFVNMGGNTVSQTSIRIKLPKYDFIKIIIKSVEIEQLKKNQEVFVRANFLTKPYPSGREIEYRNKLVVGKVENWDENAIWVDYVSTFFGASLTSRKFIPSEVFIESNESVEPSITINNPQESLSSEDIGTILSNIANESVQDDAKVKESLLEQERKKQQALVESVLSVDKELEKASKDLKSFQEQLQYQQPEDLERLQADVELLQLKYEMYKSVPSKDRKNAVLQSIETLLARKNLPQKTRSELNEIKAELQ